MTRDRGAGGNKLLPPADLVRRAKHAAVFSLAVITLCGCQDLVPQDTQSLFAPTFRRSEIM